MIVLYADPKAATRSLLCLLFVVLIINCNANFTSIKAIQIIYANHGHSSMIGSDLCQGLR